MFNSYSWLSKSPSMLQAPKKPTHKPRPSGLPFRVTPGTVHQLQDIFHRRLHEHELNRCDRLASAFLQAGIRPPKCILSATGPTEPASSIDKELCSALSTLVERTSMSLAATIAFWRDETAVDPRPNKALDPVWLDILLHGYRHRDLVVAVASRGVAHKLTSPRPPDGNHVRNHTSARKYTQALIRSVSDGQASGTYLVLELPTALRWSALRFSPFGCVPKKDADPLIEARLIHDLSYPCETSTNAKSTPVDLPALEYESVRRLAERIVVLARQFSHLHVKILKGDVKSAFRLIPVDANLAAHFAGSFGTLAIVDMALPFGWTGSPSHYGAFGSAISFLVARESPKSLDPFDHDDESFFSFVWVDDHILLEVDRGNRLRLAETALRLSMIATLGPKSINKKKFSSWSTSLVALGLTCDTQRCTVSIPADKVHKALTRIADALSHPTVSRYQVEKLLGSLRYMAICCQSTRAFLQRLHQLWRRSSRFQGIRLPQDVRNDLRWVASLLQNGAANRVPTSVMADMLEPAVHLFMDASNEGLAVLYPAAREYIRLQFDEEERLATQSSTSGGTSWFSINVREALSAVLAVLVWGPQWQAIRRPEHRPLHVRCWIDNASAVAWLGNHNTKNPASQELTRVLSCGELSFNLHVTAKHLDGSSNHLADLGSRAWTGPTVQKWTNHVRLWCQQYIPTEFRKIYKQKLPFCNGSRSPILHGKVECWQGRNETTHNRVDTVRAKLSHVRWCHQLRAGFRPSLQPQHELVIQGMQRLSPPRRKRAAVSVEMLRKIASSADMSIAQHRVVCGAAVLGFFFCLRGSEYLCSRGKRYSYCLQVGDVIVRDINGADTISFNKATSVQITLRGSKTDQSGRTSTRVLLKSGLAPICPVFAALLLQRNAIRLSLAPESPLCSTGYRQVLSSETMTKVLRASALQTGEDPRRISTHSLRTGGATALHTAGVDADTIRMHGRWASEAYKVYIREAPASALQLAKLMGNTSIKPSRTNLTRGATRAQALEGSINTSLLFASPRNMSTC